MYSITKEKVKILCKVCMGDIMSIAEVTKKMKKENNELTEKMLSIQNDQKKQYDSELKNKNILLEQTNEKLKMKIKRLEEEIFLLVKKEKLLTKVQAKSIEDHIKVH
ncbi:hypothetical protein WA026_022078 [Henosepilachna vigintioctopunctata]|uniref:Uncharacterized protein n=1 Tax=Henosepilachna vigintioctopunctata TaxID=420089 RepID=A0AAW1U781_9CUCU